MSCNGHFAVSLLRTLLLTGMLMQASTTVMAGLDRAGLIYNKVKFLDWLVHDSPVSKRVEDSTDEEANKQLQRARDMWEQAVEHSDQNEFELAEVHIDEGLKLMTAVSRKYKDQERVRKARLDLYRQVRDHVDMFVAAFDRIVEEKGEDHVRTMLDRKKLDSLIAEADSSHEKGDLVLANHLMGQAADMVDHALSDARHEDVLLRELSFETLAEEYAYEVQRNESYVMIIDMIQSKTPKSEASTAYVQRMIEANAKQRQEADSLAEQGSYKEGIALLEASTDKLSRALRVSGVSF